MNREPCPGGPPAIAAHFMWKPRPHFCFPLAAILLLTIPTLAQNDLPTLSSVTRELKGGESHSYRIVLSSGQFLHALVEQQGIDLITSVFAPDGKKLSESDSPNDIWGSEAVLVVAPTAGEYRVDVYSSDKRARAGHYRIQVVTLREATQVDKDHVEAQRSFNEGINLSVQQTATAQQSAMEKFRQAAPRFHAAGDTYREALSLSSIATSYRNLNQFRQALEFYNQTLPLAIAAGDRRLEIVVETNIGGMLDVFGDVGKALQHQQRAIELAREIGSRGQEASALSNIGKIYNDLADWQKALEFYAQALPVFRAAGLKLNEALTLNNIGIAYSQTGEQQKALEYLEQALPLMRTAGNKINEAYTLLNICRTYRRLNDYKNALDHCNQARAIQKETGSNAQAAETLDEIGVIYSAQDQPDKAAEYHEQS
ncbi:MAG TPA: tetratricopeptide repeat protein, partial [Pyrinomonadaceae bacterium]|nr:tetratricopeptide repeat protein [Pyrinomonadaceae bacterium]